MKNEGLVYQQLASKAEEDAGKELRDLNNYEREGPLPKKAACFSTARLEKGKI